MDYGCGLGVTDVSLDGCLSADPASVAGGVGTGGRDRGKRPLLNRCDVGGGARACLLGGDTTDVRSVLTALMARWPVVLTTLATPRVSPLVCHAV